MNNSTKKLIDTLQAHMAEGKLVWHNPCIMAAQANFVSGNAYSGINHFMTSTVSLSEGYKSNYWATFKQIKEAGGSLENAKGKGVPIMFYKDLEPKEGDKKKRFVAKHCFVFNLDLVTGIEAGTLPSEHCGEIIVDRSAELLVNNYLKHECISVTVGSPAYVPSIDVIRMPEKSAFTSADEWFSTVYHECAHSTGHPQRLGRFADTQTKLESKEEYSKEELVAEITSAMLCHESGVSSDASIKNSAAYLQGWSRFIADEAESFVWAIGKAYKARQFILDAGGA